MLRLIAFNVTLLALTVAPVFAQTAAPADESKPPDASQPTEPPRLQGQGPAAAGQAQPAVARPAATQPALSSPLSGAWFECPATFYNFGEVWQGANVTHRYEIRNTSSTETLIIDDVKADCHCTVPGQFERVIKPGQVGHVPFTLRTDGLGQRLSKGATIKTNDPQRPTFRVIMEGHVKTLLTMTPNSCGTFAEIIDPDSELTQTAIVTSNVDEPITLEVLPDGPARRPPNASAPASQPARPFALDLEEIEAGKKWKVTVRTVPPLPSGYLQHYFRIKTSHPNKPVWPLRASAYRPPRIAAKPVNIRLPEEVRGGSPFGTDIMNYGKATVNILSAEIADAPELRVEVVPNTDRKPRQDPWMSPDKLKNEPPPLARINIHAPMGYRLPGAKNLIVTTDDPEYPSLKITVYSVSSRGLPPVTAAASQPAGATGVAATQPARPTARVARPNVGVASPPGGAVLMGGGDAGDAPKETRGGDGVPTTQPAGKPPSE